MSQPRSSWTGFVAAALYMIVSVIITFANKAVLATFHFSSPNIMTLAQMIVSLILLVVMKAMKAIRYPDFQLSTARNTAPLSMAFVLMVLTGLAALEHMNIPMYNAMRRLATPITMIGEAWLLGAKESTRVQLSVWMMVFGATVASYYDLTFNFIGYVLVILNCIFTAMYLLFIAKFGKQGLNTFGLMFYTNLLSIPIVVLVCYANGDFEKMLMYPHLYDWGFIFCFLLQAALAFFLNWTIFWCTNVNSALATSVSGQIKNILTTAIGYFSFGDVKYDPFNVAGLIMGIAASGWYSQLKFEESQAKKRDVLPTSSKSLTKEQSHKDAKA